MTAHADDRQTVAVTGSGLAELTCAWLLAEQGHRVHVTAGPTGGSRPLVLGGETAALLASVWRTDLVAGAWPLRGRLVRWGRGEPVRVAAPALAIDGAVLVSRALDRLADLGTVEIREHGGGPVPGSARWTVTAAPGEAAAVEAGRRRMLVGRVRLKAGEAADVTVLETVPGGWLHLFPVGGGEAVAQAMVPGPAERPAALLAALLAESGLDARLDGACEQAVAVPAAPRLLDDPAAPGRLVVGGGALRLDPIAGTGTAQAVRTAILAAAVIGSASRAGGPYQDRCRDHYRARLRHVFHGHVLTCARLYAEAFATPDWADELDAMRRVLRVPAPAPAGLRLVAGDEGQGAPVLEAAPAD